MTPTAVITGASAGIGQATAILLAKKGYNLVLAARTNDRLEAVAEQTKELGSQVLAIPTDVTDVKQVNNLVEKALDTYAQVDILINNAGICMTAPMT
ncbi:SDR family NAD(P)-dependent oxidoreductase, partial [Crocosphaera watsonii]